MEEEYKKEIYNKICKEVFITSSSFKIVSSPENQEITWLMDFRRIMLNSDFLDKVSYLAIKECKLDDSFQVGGLESASIPLIAGIVLKSKNLGFDIKGFFIRKSRKKQVYSTVSKGYLMEEKKLSLLMIF